MAESVEAYVEARMGALFRYGFVLTGNRHDAAGLAQQALARLGARWTRPRRRGHRPGRRDVGIHRPDPLNSAPVRSTPLFGMEPDELDIPPDDHRIRRRARILFALMAVMCVVVIGTILVRGCRPP